jgi:hypothetical protein
MPIKKYKDIHTGPKIQPGGLKKGLFRFRYQLETDDAVKKEPIKPANWH